MRVYSPRAALTHLKLIDGAGAAAVDDRTLIIESGRIAAVGPSVSIQPPADAVVVDLRGHTVLPGLVGMHDHLFCAVPPGVPDDYVSTAKTFPRERSVDPAERIADIRNVVVVFKNGVGFDSAALLESVAGLVGESESGPIMRLLENLTRALGSNRCRCTRARPSCWSSCSRHSRRGWQTGTAPGGGADQAISSGCKPRRRSLPRRRGPWAALASRERSA